MKANIAARTTKEPPSLQKSLRDFFGRMQITHVDQQHRFLFVELESHQMQREEEEEEEKMNQIRNKEEKGVTGNDSCV